MYLFKGSNFEFFYIGCYISKYMFLMVLNPKKSTIVAINTLFPHFGPILGSNRTI